MADSSGFVYIQFCWIWSLAVLLHMT